MLKQRIRLPDTGIGSARGPGRLWRKPARCYHLPRLGVTISRRAKQACAFGRRKRHRLTTLDIGGNLMQKGFGIAAAVALTAVVGTSAHAADKLKVGVTATLEGTYTVLGEDGMRGYELAVKAHNGKAGGKEIETIVGATDASPDSAIRAVKKLVEQDKVDVLMSPLSGSEGIAVKDWSKTQPQITVINASSGALETTYVDPSPTFYRYNLDGAQWQAGLGDYIYNVKPLQEDRDDR